MNDAQNTNSQPWHLRFARDKFLRPWMLYFLGFVYATVFLIVAGLMYLLNWIFPHLPWIPKSYVSPDPPPLVTAFYCANLMGGFTMMIVLMVYLGGPSRKILPSSFARRKRLKRRDR